MKFENDSGHHLENAWNHIKRALKEAEREGDRQAKVMRQEMISWEESEEVLTIRRNDELKRTGTFEPVVELSKRGVIQINLVELATRDPRRWRLPITLSHGFGHHMYDAFVEGRSWHYEVSDSWATGYDNIYRRAVGFTLKTSHGDHPILRPE